MPDDDNEKRHSDNMAVLAVAAIIVILGIVLLHWLSTNLKTERCQEERRHDCVPTDAP